MCSTADSAESARRAARCNVTKIVKIQAGRKVENFDDQSKSAAEQQCSGVHSSVFISSIEPYADEHCAAV
jgi:hypothetical protein